MFTPGELEGIPFELTKNFSELELRIMEDIIRRIRINGEITRSADWQIHRLHELGVSKRDIKKIIKDTLKLSIQEINHLYKDVLRKGYERDSSIYKAKGKSFIPFSQNNGLQQLITAVTEQTNGELKNITQSMGFAVKQADGTLSFTPIADYYQKTLDGAMLDITSGAFDYNTVLRRVVNEMTNSGLRTVDYASGVSSRIEVAARRAVMTGFNQTVAKINDDNAKKLGTEYFEVSWHGGARPSHQKWQGRVYTKKQLKTVCGLGDVQGLCGANCYHSYFPFFPGISERQYTDEELDRMNAEENIPKEDITGKSYTKYEALQRQRYLERKMRAERQKIHLLKEGGADEEQIILARARYRGTSAEYTRFSKAMNLPQERDRVTIDGLGNIGQGKTTLPKKDGLKGKSSGGGSGGKISQPKLVGKLDFSDESAIMSSLEEFEKANRELDFERCRVITSDGKIWDVDGSEGSVFTDIIQTQENGSSLKGSYSYHNHPKRVTYYSFSGEDVGDFLSHGEAFAKASDDKYEYTMRRTEKTLQSGYTDVVREFKQIRDNDVLEKAFLDEIDFDENGFHETMKILSKKYSFIYERHLIDDK